MGRIEMVGKESQFRDKDRNGRSRRRESILAAVRNI